MVVDPCELIARRRNQTMLTVKIDTTAQRPQQMPVLEDAVRTTEADQ
jgi:hypothetical protein